MPAAAAVIGYLLGSIPFAFLAGRLRGGLDIRRIGSGNVGAANLLRASGTPVALGVLALDIVKGAAGVVCVQRLGGGDEARALAGLAAVVGHVYPIWLGGRGGKGVATAAGVFGVLSPVAVAAAAAVFVAAVWITRFVSVGSMLAAATLAPLAWSAGAPAAVVSAAAAAGALVLFRHRGNAARLLAGSERRLGQRLSS